MVTRILDAATTVAGLIFLSGDIFGKHYGIVRTAESRITLLRFLNFWRQTHIHKLGYTVCLVVYRITVKVTP